mmetsp:Transcript_123178/g.230273  ORF Transcript_123178/g.230273 Transcript_123178/m.230273 type:complete len:447 (-) Transcript_123178:118-1458(-)
MEAFGSTQATLQGCASFWMTIGQGAAEGFYQGSNGFYILKFQRSSFFVSMLLCLMGPKPLVSWLQQICDPYFDKRLSTEVTYVFRVISMQLVLAGIMVIWMCAPESEAIVLLIGLLIGLLGSAVVSSSLQMSAAMNPGSILSAKIGMQCGGLVIVILMSATGFSPEAHIDLLREELATVVGLCIGAALILTIFHVKTDIFTKAYKRLSYGLAPSPDVLAPVSETDELLSEGAWTRDYTETKGLDPEALEGVPPWVGIWQACVFLEMTISMYLLSLAGFFENSALAQKLVQCKLAMELLGRLGGMAVPLFPSFEDGPAHKTMAASLICIILCGTVVLIEMFSDACPKVLFLFCWCAVFAVGIFANSLADVTSATYVRVQDRKDVARTNQMVIVSGYLFGLILSEVTCDIMESTHANKMDGLPSAGLLSASLPSAFIQGLQQPRWPSL